MPYVHSEEFQISYEVMCRAEGPTLLLVPGIGEQIGSVEFPIEQCRVLAKRGFQIVRMENRDSGFSVPTVPEEKISPYTLKDLADDAAAVISDVGTGPVHLVGASLGGFIDRWAAIRHPVKIRTLAVDTPSGTQIAIMKDSND
jgi:pimeloyl-ACP methyl ester carboxylesterase